MVESALLKDVIVDPSTNKGGGGLKGHIKKNLLFIYHLPNWDTVLVSYGSYSTFLTNLVA